jgi:hypothetical protein
VFVGEQDKISWLQSPIATRVQMPSFFGCAVKIEQKQSNICCMAFLMKTHHTKKELFFKVQALTSLPKLGPAWQTQMRVTISQSSHSRRCYPGKQYHKIAQNLTRPV